MLFNPNQTEFNSDYQRIIWQHGTHIVPLDVSLADVEDEETREGCTQIYNCTMEILSDMYNRSEDYTENPLWNAGGFLLLAVSGGKPMKKHDASYANFLQKLPRFGFSYHEDTGLWSNDRYPLLGEYLPRLNELAKTRKQNMGGYFGRLDFRLFAKRIHLTFDDLLRPLSDKNRAYALELHNYAISMGMKMEMKDPYMFRYTYKKIYSVELLNNPFRVMILYQLNNGKHIYDQFNRFLSVAEMQPDASALVRYIQGGIWVCTGCYGLHKASKRCGKWLDIHGARRLASMCHPAISKVRRGTRNLDYYNEDIQMLKRLIDVRIIQVDEFLR